MMWESKKCSTVPVRVFPSFVKLNVVVEINDFTLLYTYGIHTNGQMTNFHLQDEQREMAAYIYMLPY